MRRAAIREVDLVNSRTEYDNGWAVEVGIGKRCRLGLVDPDGNEVNSLSFPGQFWLKRRSRTQVKNFLTETTHIFRDDYDSMIPLCRPNEDGEIEIDRKRFQIFLNKVREDAEAAGERKRRRSRTGSVPEMEEEWLRGEAEKLLESPDLLNVVDEAIHREHSFVGETKNVLLTFFSMLSTLTEEPVNLRLSGRSSRGKSTIVVTAGGLFPEDMVILESSPTRRSFYYREDMISEIRGTERWMELDRKILIILEEENSEEFLGEIKELLSHDVPVTPMRHTRRGPKGPVTHTLWMVGWPSYVGVTVVRMTEEAQESRTMLASPKGGSEKYGSVISRKAWEKSFPWLKSRKKRTRVIKKAISLLERRKVWNPLAFALQEKFPRYKARMMRDWERLIGLVDSVTILFERQRESILVDGEKYLVSTPLDFDVALRICSSALSEAMMGLEDEVVEFYKHLEEIGDAFNYQEMMRAYEKRFGESISRRTLRRRITDPLVDKGLLEKDESKRPYEFSISMINLAKIGNFRKRVGDLCDRDLEEEVVDLFLESLGTLESGGDKVKVLTSDGRPLLNSRVADVIKKTFVQARENLPKIEPILSRSDSVEYVEHGRKLRKSKMPTNAKCSAKKKGSEAISVAELIESSKEGAPDEPGQIEGIGGGVEPGVDPCPNGFCKPCWEMGIRKTGVRKIPQHGEDVLMCRSCLQASGWE